MSLRQKPTKGIPYWLFTAGREKTIHLGPVNDPSKINPEKVMEAIDYVRKKYGHYTGIEYKLIAFLPSPQKEQYISKHLKELETEQKYLLSLSPSAAKQYKPESLVKAEEETRRRQAEIEYFAKCFDNVKKIELHLFPISRTKVRHRPTIFVRDDMATILEHPEDSEIISKIMKETGGEEMIKKLLAAGVHIIIEELGIEIKKYLKEIFEEFYSVHKSKPFFNELAESFADATFPYLDYLQNVTKENVWLTLKKLFRVKKDEVEFEFRNKRLDYDDIAYAIMAYEPKSIRLRKS